MHVNNESKEFIAADARTSRGTMLLYTWKRLSRKEVTGASMWNCCFNWQSLLESSSSIRFFAYFTMLSCVCKRKAVPDKRWWWPTYFRWSKTLVHLFLRTIPGALQNATATNLHSEAYKLQSNPRLLHWVSNQSGVKSSNGPCPNRSLRMRLHSIGVAHSFYRRCTFRSTMPIFAQLD